MNKTTACLAMLFFSFFSGCSLDRGGEFTLTETDDAASVPDQQSDQASSDADAGHLPETGTPDSDAPEDALPDTPMEDSPVDSPPDAPEDAIEEDSTIDSPEDVAEPDSPLDAPPNPVDCFGVSTEAGDVMICGSLPGGTAKSLMFKAEIIPAGSGQSIPFKSVCWSEVGVAELACFPCPGPNLCWPIPDGGFPHAPAHPGDVIKFQPGIADGPGLDMKNTLCELGACYQGTYVVYSGHTEVCRVNTDGTRAGNVVYEGTGTDVKIVCTL